MKTSTGHMIPAIFSIGNHEGEVFKLKISLLEQRVVMQSQKGKCLSCFRTLRNRRTPLQTP
jgi:hypothetical protein